MILLLACRITVSEAERKMTKRRHISGREATYMAIESDKRGPVQIEPSTEEDAAWRPSVCR